MAIMGPVRLSFTPQRILRFVLINAAFIAFLSLWNGQLHRESVQLAVAKSQQIIDMMFDLNARQGTTLVLVTHDEAIAARCARILRIHSGRLV